MGARDYFDVDAWVDATTETITTLPVLADNHELAGFDRAEALRRSLISNDNDWLILTNRLAARHGMACSSVRVLHLRRDVEARSAIDAALPQGGMKIDLADVSAKAGFDVARLRTVLLNTLDSSTPYGGTRVEGPHVWINDSVVEFPKRIQRSAESLTIGGPTGYPHEALLGLYDRSGIETFGGAAGRVARHRLRRGTVWAPWATEVAVKLIPEHHLVRMNGSVAKGRERVLREFNAGRGSVTPLLATTFDVFLTSFVSGTEGQRPIPHYGIVQEWIEGPDLSEPSSATLEERARRALQLVEAVRELHSRGIVHRDIKPANAKHSSRGVVLMDYGISKHLDDATVTTTHDKLFTDKYASPEQIHGEEGEVGDDVFALGLSVFEILTGVSAYEGYNKARMINDKYERRSFDVQSLRAKAPRFADLVALMTAPQRANRPSIDLVVDYFRTTIENRPPPSLPRPPNEPSTRKVPGVTLEMVGPNVYRLKVLRADADGGPISNFTGWDRGRANYALSLARSQLNDVARHAEITEMDIFRMLESVEQAVALQYVE